MIIKKEENFPDDELFIFCLESVDDVEDANTTEVFRSLKQLSEKGIPSIHNVCDTIEGLEDSLNNLLYEDHNFQNYEIIYLVLQGEVTKFNLVPSYLLDQAFFAMCEAENDITKVVEELYRKHYTACKLLDFKLYY